MSGQRKARRGAKEPRREPQQDRGKQTVDFILEALDRLIDERGIQGVTIRDVARLAGASVGTLYQYFPTREALLAAWAERMWRIGIENVVTVAQRLHNERAPMSDAIREIVRTIVGIVVRGGSVVGEELGAARYRRRLELVDGASLMLSAMLEERRPEGTVRDGNLRVRCMLVASSIVEGSLAANRLVPEAVADGTVHTELSDFAVRVLLT